MSSLLHLIGNLRRMLCHRGHCLYTYRRYRSDNLVDFAKQHQPHTAIVADSLDLPHPRHSFDFAISIAVIHHLSTPARRVQAVEALLETLRPDGRALIFVWALEQKDSRRGWDTGHDQDVMVPWVMKIGQAKSQKAQKSKDAAYARVTAGFPANGEQDQVSTSEDIPSGDRTFHRYYHLYKSGELERDIVQAGGVVLESGYERDNWWAILSRR